MRLRLVVGDDASDVGGTNAGRATDFSGGAVLHATPDVVAPANTGPSTSPSPDLGTDAVGLEAVHVYGLWAGDANGAGTVTAPDAKGRWRTRRSACRLANLGARVLADDRRPF